MAIYSWIYANAKRNENLDYCSRGGHRELKEWGLTTNMDSLLPKIASRLISPNYRNLNRHQRPCWFAGYLDEEKYMVAVGGTQEDLLQMPIDDGAFRIQLCVFAYIFTGEDIGLYKRDIAMFEPLKEKLKLIQYTKIEEENGQLSCLIKKDLSFYKLLSYDEYEDNFNILESKMDTDAFVWTQSLQRPVAVGIPTMKDAEQLLDLFPEKNGLVTVLDGTKKIYQPKQMYLEEMTKRNIEKEKRKTAIKKIDAIKRTEYEKERNWILSSIQKLEDYLYLEKNVNLNQSEKEDAIWDLREIEQIVKERKYEEKMHPNKKDYMEQTIKSCKIETEKVELVRCLCILKNVEKRKYLKNTEKRNSKNETKLKNHGLSDADIDTIFGNITSQNVISHFLFPLKKIQIQMQKIEKGGR